MELGEIVRITSTIRLTGHYNLGKDTIIESKREDHWTETVDVHHRLPLHSTFPQPEASTMTSTGRSPHLTRSQSHPHPIDGTTERTPLLWESTYSVQPTVNNPNDTNDRDRDPHDEFCMMVGVPSSAPTPDGKPKPSWSTPPKSLYGRATRQLSKQRTTYYGTATLSNTMLLAQVVLGAALTALGASESSHILITLFGATNTVIAGLVAYLKSRGQPMRARMYRDDLERVVDEIENSEIMWLGIAKGVHGYEDIDTGSTKDGKEADRNPNAVTVRSEVARLTRLYDRAVRNNTVNNPDMYMNGGDGGGGGATLRNRTGGGASAAAPTMSAPVVNVAIPEAPQTSTAVVVAVDPDESPATAPPKAKEEKAKEEKPKEKEEEGKKKEADEEVGDKGEEKEKSDEGDGKGKGKAEGNKTDGEASSKTPTAGMEKPKDKDEGPPTSPPAPSASASASKPVPPASAPPVAPVSAPAPATPAQPPRDPDAEPASDPNVPLRKVQGDTADGE